MQTGDSIFLESLQKFIHFVKISADQVKELVHQFCLLHFRDIDYHPLTSSFHPSGFGMGTSAARKYQQTGVRPIEGIKVRLELTL